MLCVVCLSTADSVDELKALFCVFCRMVRSLWDAKRFFSPMKYSCPQALNYASTNSGAWVWSRTERTTGDLLGCSSHILSEPFLSCPTYKEFPRFKTSLMVFCLSSCTSLGLWVSEVYVFFLASAETHSLEILWPISIDGSSRTRKAEARNILIDPKVYLSSSVHWGVIFLIKSQEKL